MVGSGHGKFDAEEVMQGLPEVSSEAGISIRDDDFGEAVVLEDVIEEELCDATTGDLVIGCDEVCSFAGCRVVHYLGHRGWWSRGGDHLEA
jgi:hypothetical protein